MKTLFIYLLTCTTYYAATAQKTWNLDNLHSNIRFEVGWEEFSVRTGEFKIFNGSMETSGIEDLSDASFELTVNPGSIDVIAERLNKTLRSETFLDTAKYKEITYKTSSIEKTSDSTYIATGTLDLHGIQQEEMAMIEKTGLSSRNGKHTMGIKVNLIINRKDYELIWGGDRLADQVEIIGYFLFRTSIR